ncbi:MAG: rRNA pseudouridine synthase [Spirochaetaceae bacterium]|nr:rRNA pseudouridine synthase [Spirochaetaceae bacterium]
MNLKEANEKAGPLRLQVFLARSGVASRRRSEAVILQGRVTVNGEIVTLLGTKVEPDSDIRVDGIPVRTEKKRHYLAMNKPPRYLCSSRDPQGRSLALELIPPDITERLYNVGRLDYLSSGLIFFTNDGNFAARISHPGSEIEKEYLIESKVPVPDRVIDDFLAGINIEGETYRARAVERLGRRSLRIVLIEGKNREIRRVFSYFHLSPRLLKRIRIGPVELGTLEEGKTRRLTEGELFQFRKYL